MGDCLRSRSHGDSGPLSRHGLEIPHGSWVDPDNSALCITLNKCRYFLVPDMNVEHHRAGRSLRGRISKAGLPERLRDGRRDHVG